MLLAPAPVMGFTWLGAWSTPGGQSSHAPPPVFTSTDSKTSRGFDQGTLTVDMGQASGIGLSAGSKIVLQRNLLITGNADEFITVSSSYTTILQDAKLHVTVEFVPLANGHGAHKVKFIDFHKSAGDHTRVASQDKTRERLVRYGSEANGGNYTAIVTVEYSTRGDKNEINQWNNVSAHTFTFSGA